MMMYSYVLDEALENSYVGVNQPTEHKSKIEFVVFVAAVIGHADPCGPADCLVACVFSFFTASRLSALSPFQTNKHHGREQSERAPPACPASLTNFLFIPLKNSE